MGVPKMTDCSEYDCIIDSGKVTNFHPGNRQNASAKSCRDSRQAADNTTYVWDYKNDENKDLGLEVGAVVHNREWSYGLVKYASLVQMAVSVKDKVIRCPQKLSSRKPGSCGEKIPTPSTSTTQESIAEVGDQARVVVEKKYRAEADAMMKEGVEAVRASVKAKYGLRD